MPAKGLRRIRVCAFSVAVAHQITATHGGHTTIAHTKPRPTRRTLDHPLFSIDRDDKTGCHLETQIGRYALCLN